MRPALLSRTLHKWLALFVGLQLVLWTLSGFYMVVVDLDFIHGDPLVRNLRVPLTIGQPLMPVADVSQRHPAVTQVALRTLPALDRPVYEVTANGRKVLLDAVNGTQLSPLSQGFVRELARNYYAGSGAPKAVTLIEHDAPSEIQTRPLPLWRIDFDDWLETSLYIHPDTGTLVTRRHRFWRWFDFLWMLHIMDYDAREDINNGLLRFTTVLGAVTAVSGVWLLYFSFRRKRPVSA
jgi:uncharacterized iron-regulated membrane protein